jgi:hypothetical protein
MSRTWDIPVRISSLTDGQVLDYTYFWGGRSSCKRSLLVNHGVFNQQFRFGSEDIELGYRLVKCGFKVIFHRSAIQYMNRRITYDEFCRRCEKQGISQHMFSRLHAADEIQQYCQVKDAESQWRDIQESLGSKVGRVHEIESILSKNGLPAAMGQCGANCGISTGGPSMRSS